MKYSDFFHSSIDDFKRQNRYREFVNLERIRDNLPYAIDLETKKKVVVWCSNDYLGMSGNGLAIEKSVDVLKKSGLGSGGTRNISGTSSQIVELEKELARLYGREMALAFISGYVCNDSSIQALLKIIPDLVIFSDEKNHASIISGIRNSGAKKEIFRHNDEVHLEELLQKYDENVPKLIIFESVYSMDGDFAKVEKIVNLAKKYGCITYCDEVHGVGLYGEKGRGLCDELGFLDEIDIVQGTFAKAYGVIGGFICAKKEIVDAIRLNSSGFIFSTALPPSIIAGIRENVRYLAGEKGDDLRKRLKSVVVDLKAALKEAKIDIVDNSSHIVSVRIGDAKKSQEISVALRKKYGIYVQNINFPTVAKGDERLRITANPYHSKKMIDELIFALKECL